MLPSDHHASRSFFPPFPEISLKLSDVIGKTDVDGKPE